ncbi:hypothetical protein CN047_05015 [Campylobacter jejuni]|nr:hypothetical protein [Campylobacter jejuni]
MKIKYYLQVKGSANAGKTSTITRTFLKMLEQEQVKLEKIKNLDSGDFVALINAENKNLAFISSGDIEEVSKKSYDILLELSQKDIDVLIVATRTKGKTIEFWEKILEENHKDALKDYLENKDWFAPENKKEISPYIDKQSNKLLEKIEKALRVVK